MAEPKRQALVAPGRNGLVVDIDERVAERRRRALASDNGDCLGAVDQTFGGDDRVDGNFGILARAVVVLAIQFGKNGDSADMGNLMAVQRRLERRHVFRVVNIVGRECDGHGKPLNIKHSLSVCTQQAECNIPAISALHRQIDP